MTNTFTQAMQAFKTEARIKYLPGTVAKRRVQEMGKGRGRRRYGGRESGRYGGIGIGLGKFSCNRGLVYSPKLGSKVITLMNGKKIDDHAHINFSDDIYHQMKKDQ